MAFNNKKKLTGQKKRKKRKKKDMVDDFPERPFRHRGALD